MRPAWGAGRGPLVTDMDLRCQADRVLRAAIARMTEHGVKPSDQAEYIAYALADLTHRACDFQRHLNAAHARIAERNRA